MKTLRINDVFPLVDIPDNSFTFFLVLVGIGCVIVVFVGYFFYKKHTVNKISTREKQLNILKNCDFKNPKPSVYQISYYGRLLVSSPQEKEAIEAIITELEPYKYDKFAPAISDDIQKQVQGFVHTIQDENV